MGLIGTALGVAGSVIGGIAASRAAKKVKGNLEARKRENESWYDRNYNRDFTQSVSAQRVMSAIDERTRRNRASALGAAAVGGATEESVAARMAADNAAAASALSNIAIEGERRRDNVDAQYRSTKNGLDDAINKVEMRRAGDISSAVGGIADAAGNLSMGSARMFGREVGL